MCMRSFFFTWDKIIEKLEHNMPGEDGIVACCHHLSMAVKILGAVFITLCPCINVLLGTIHVCKWGGKCCMYYFYRDLVINPLLYTQH